MILNFDEHLPHEPDEPHYNRIIAEVMLEERIDFSPLDRHFARFLTSLAGLEASELYYAAALLSHHVSEGHVCLDLRRWERRQVVVGDEQKDVFRTPALADWKMKLEGTSVVGRPGDFRPLVLDDQCRLYLYRYWEYENILAERIRRMAFDAGGPMIERPDKQSVARLFPGTPAHEPDWQMIAALIACTGPFTVISGSPGTGKTTTVARILALLLEQPAAAEARIALAAPTGKAAARLQEAIRSAKGLMDCEASIKASIPEKASTVHRLLGSLSGSSRFRHHEGNPLAADIIVIDEASMMDLPLLSKLLQAMPEKARLILLGDKDQLASVEAGAVLGDICGDVPANLFSRKMVEKLIPYTGDSLPGHVGGAQTPGIHDCIVQLQRNYRFAGSSEIGEVSASVNRGEGARLLQELKERRYQSVCWSPMPEFRNIERILKPVVLEGFGAYLDLMQSNGAWEDIFAAFERFRVLCAFRQGPFGVVSINQRIENILGKEHLISPKRPYYCGQPVMITGNHAQLRLYNGDTGLLLPHPEESGELMAVFPDGPGRFRPFSPGRLPAHETAYATTVHKSQGSEFDGILLILSGIDAPILTRELVYTGITRARNRVLLWSAEDVLIASISRCIQRTSGLREALWQSPS